MTGKRIIVFALFAVAALAFALSARGSVEAQTFKPVNSYSLTSTVPGANSNSVLSTGIAAPDYNLEDASSTNLNPPDSVTAMGIEAPIGAVVGSLSANAAVGLMGGLCNSALPPNFQLKNASVDISDELATTAWILKPAATNPVPDTDGDGLYDYEEQYPWFLNDMFDPDGAGPLLPLQPRARFAGHTNVAGFNVLVQLVVFNAGQITAAGGIYAQMTADKGAASVVILDNPLGEGEAEPGAISDFCSPLTTSTTLLATTADNPRTEWINDGCPAKGDPEGDDAGEETWCYNAVDDDGDTNVNDGCPALGPAENPACVNSIDDDAADDPDDRVNDGCPAKDAPEDPATQCANAVDDDGDTRVNDGCPINGSLAEDPSCANAVNDDAPDSEAGYVRQANPAASTGVALTGTHMALYYTQSERNSDGDLFENDFDGCRYTADPAAWDPRAAACVAGSFPGDQDCDMLPSSCDPNDGANNTDQDADGYDNAQDNCPLVANGCKSAACGPTWNPAWDNQEDSDSGLADADLGPRTDSLGDSCDDSDDDGNEDGGAAGDCNDGIDNGGADQVDIINGGVDVDESGVVGADDDLTDRLLILASGGADQVDIINGGVDVDESGGVGAEDDLSNVVLILAGGGADQVDIINGGVDVNESGVVGAEDDLNDVVAGDGIDGDDPDCQPSMDKADPPSGTSAQDGAYYHGMPWAAVCVGSTDTDGDGYCDSLEEILGSPTNNGAETGAQCTNALDDDGDTFVNDGCLRVGKFSETGAQCANAASDDTPTPDSTEAPVTVNDGCPVIGTPESLMIDATITAAAALPSAGAPQSCSDLVDNDKDGLIDAADSGCQAMGGDTDNDGWADNADVGFDPEIAQDHAGDETVKRDAALDSLRFTYDRTTGVIKIGNLNGDCWILSPAKLADGDTSDWEAIAVCAGSPRGFWRTVNLDGTGNGVDEDGDTTVDDGCYTKPAAVGVSEAADHCYDAVDDDGDTTVDDGCPGGPAAVGVSEAADWCAGGDTDYDIAWVKFGWDAGLDPTGTDNCPSVWNPTQTNTDATFAATSGFPAGDAQGDACDTDDDADGFTDAIEAHLPTDPLDRCRNGSGATRSDAWGLDQDLNATITVVGDVLKYSGKIGASVSGSPPTSWATSRLDLDGNRTITVVGDVLKYSGKIGATCT